MPDSFYRWEGHALILDLYVQPKASRAEIVGVHGARLKIKVTAPPVDGKANADVQKLLAKVFKVAKSNITLIKGETGREKQVRIEAPQALWQGIVAADS